MTCPRLSRVVQIFALFDLAVAYPMLDMLSRAPMTIVEMGVGRPECVLLVLSLCMVIPGLLVLMEAGLRRWGEVFHVVLVTLLSGLAVMWAVHVLFPQKPSWKPLAFLEASVLAALFYMQSRQARSFFTALAPAVVAVPAMFLMAPNIRAALQPPAAPLERLPFSGKASPIVVIVFDEFPLTSLLDERQRIDAARFPSFASLAADGTWYRNATSYGCVTQESLPAILTGRYQQGDESQPLQARRSLFSLLAGTYRIHAQEVVTAMAAVRREHGALAALLRTARVLRKLAGVYGTWLVTWSPADTMPPTPVHSEPSPGMYNPGAFERFLEEIRPGDGPVLHFGHFITPHVPWIWLPSGHRYNIPLMPLPQWPNDQGEVDLSLQRHLLQVGYADRLLGRLLARLKSQDLYDDALVLVVADHGIVFFPGTSTRDPVPQAVMDLYGVPFILKLPHQRKGQVSDRNVEQVDIVPTLADAAGAAWAWPMDGQSLLRPVVPRPDKLLHPYGRVPSPVSLDTVAWRRKVQRLGTGPFGARFFGLGPFPTLVGRRVSDLVEGGEPPVRSWLQDADTFQQVQPESTPLPVYVVGRVEGAGVARALAVAIAVGGVVEAVPRVIPGQEGVLAFSAMIREEALQPGANDVRVYLVERRGTRIVLIPTEASR